MTDANTCHTGVYISILVGLFVWGCIIQAHADSKPKIIVYPSGNDVTWGLRFWRWITHTGS